MGLLANGTKWIGGFEGRCLLGGQHIYIYIYHYTLYYAYYYIMILYHYIYIYIYSFVKYVQVVRT